MKKIVALMLAVIMLACAVAGCGEKETPTTESTTTVTTAATTTTTEETVATTDRKSVV